MFKKEFEFLALAERLKMELRHSWLSNGRQESVAEHSWQLALMVLRYADKLDKPVNLETCLKLAIVHDLAEAKTGDAPTFVINTLDKKLHKMAKEQQAMQDIKLLLSDVSGDQLYNLWLDYEQRISYESQFVRALDKLEAFIQHIHAPIDTWEYIEKKMLFQEQWLIQPCAFDSFLTTFCKAVIEQAIHKLEVAGENIAQIKQDAEVE